MELNFNNFKNIKYKNNDILKINRNNDLIWYKLEKIKYPLNLLDKNITDYSFIDIDSLKVDYNILLSLFIKYYNIEPINSSRSDIEFYNAFKGKFLTGYNLFNNSNNFVGVEWVYNNDWRLEDEEFNGNKVMSYEGSWNFITYNYSIPKNTIKNYTFSFYAKTDKTDVSGSIFINDETDNNHPAVSESFKEIKLTDKWQRYSITFSVNSGNKDVIIRPNIQLPTNAKLYLSSYMLSEGEDLKDYDNGSLVTSNDFEDIMKQIYNSGFKKLQPSKIGFVVYDNYYDKKLNEKLKPYMEKLIFKNISDKDKLLSEIQKYPSEYNKLPNRVSSENNNNKILFEKSYNNFTDKYVPNINMGYAPYSRWGEYSDDMKTVYMDMRWNEVENEKGVYNWENWEKLTRWKYIESKGYSVIFRLILDDPTDTKHSDLPKYLTLSKYGRYYSTDYGKGFAPDYDNDELLENYTKFVNAFIDRYNLNRGSSLITAIQFGIIGHWGEWHNHPSLPQFPNSEKLKKYLIPFVEKLTNIDFMFRRPFKFIEQLQTEYPNNRYGVYNDMIGDKQETEEWLKWLNSGGEYESLKIVENDMVKAYPNYYHKGLIGGEFTSSTSMKTMLVDKLDQTIDLIKKSHTSIIGQKYPLKENMNEDEYKIAYNKILDVLGYKIFVKNIKIDFPTFSESDTNKSVIITIKNVGTTDMLGEFNVNLDLYSSYEYYDNRRLYYVAGTKIKDLKAGEERIIKIGSSFNGRDFDNVQQLFGNYEAYETYLFELSIKKSFPTFDINLANTDTVGKNKLRFLIV